MAEENVLKEFKNDLISQSDWVKLDEDEKLEVVKKHDGLIDIMIGLMIELGGKEVLFKKGELKEMGKKEIMTESYERGIDLTVIILAKYISPSIVKEALYEMLKDCYGESFKKAGRTLEELDTFIKFYMGDKDAQDKFNKDLKESGIDADVNNLGKYNGEISTPEDIVRATNAILFKGDWKKHFEWSEKNLGGERAKEEIPLIRKLMNEKYK